LSNKKVTIRDIARESGFSVATVSRYINKVSYTSPETEKKIQEVLDRFNYTPNAIARGLAKQKSNTIALVTPDITNPFFPEIVKSVENASKALGYSLLLMNTDEKDLVNMDFWNNFKSRYIDGFILAGEGLSEEVRSYLSRVQLPYIPIDRAVYAEDQYSVSVNNYEGARMAVRHLVEIGCRKIAHISGPQSLYLSQERSNGYKSIIENESYGPILYEGDFTLESGTRVTEKLLEEHLDVDGIFYANDLMAIGALKAFRKRQIAIPEDIAIIGFDGIKLTEIVSPEISTIKQPIESIGEMATKQLIRLIEQQDEANCENVSLDVELIVRESTRK
jgi:LacI family transcriptional regulator